MAVNNLMTLTEYAKGLGKDDIRRPIIEMFTQYSDVMEALPFEGLTGSVYLGHREAALPVAAFRGINEGSSSGHGTISPFQEATYIIDHNIDVDRAIVDRHGPERRTYEQKMGITAFARLWVDTFIKGDQSTNPRVFNGLQIRAQKFGRLYHNSTASGGAALSLTGFVMQSWDEIAKLKLSYGGIPFLWGYPKDDHPPVLQFNEVATGGGSAVTASLYVLALGEGNLRGIQIVPLAPEEVGLLQDRITYRTHIKWDVGIVDEHKYCMARLDSWTNAAIVA